MSANPFDQSWSIQITKRNGSTVAYCPELKIIGKGRNTQDAVADLEAKQQKYFTEMTDNGLADQIPSPQVIRRRKKVARQLGLFWAKHFALALFYVVVFITAGKIVGKQIGKGVQQANKEWNIFTAASGSEDKAKRLENFKEDVNNLKPFFKELRKAWKETE